MTVIDPQRPVYRFIVLLFVCLLSFGSNYCFDMPSVLQDQFQDPRNCPPNSTNCTEGLGMTGVQYNLLYAVYSWTNAVVVIFSGIFIDKFGNIIGVLLFSSLCVLGSIVFAIGSMLDNSTSLISVMLVGRLLLGAGNGSVNILQFRLNSIWFHGKEISLAFGATIAFSRLGSSLNFFCTEALSKQIGISSTLWFGAGLCMIGLSSAAIVSYLDWYGCKKLAEEHGQNIAILAPSRAVKFSDIRHLPLSFWLACFGLMFFYNAFFPFVADASDFIADKWNYKDEKASVVAGGAYDVSMILAPTLGLLIDHVGKRGFLAIGCGLLSLPIFPVLGWSGLYPLVPVLYLGCTYSLAAATFWPSIPLTVRHDVVGTALGIAMSSQMVGMATSNLVVGAIIGDHVSDLPRDEMISRWRHVMIYLTANIVASLLVSIALCIWDLSHGGKLNQPTAANRKPPEPLLVDPPSHVQHDDYESSEDSSTLDYD